MRYGNQALRKTQRQEGEEDHEEDLRQEVSGSRGRWARLAREPLFHFVAIGAVLLAAYRVAGGPGATGEVVVSDELVRGLRADYLRRTGTWPSPEEEKALVDHYVDDEVLYREAMALGLDRGDVIVRRRLIQKMEFLLEEPVAEPTDAELDAYLAAHAERYAEPDRVALRHVFVGRDRHGEDAGRIAAGIRRSLLNDADPDALGDPFLRGGRFALQNEKEIASIFGASFASQVMDLPAGAWSEPIRSSYGLHLVEVTERLAARLPALDEVRSAVRGDWLTERRAAADREALARLRDRYRLRFEGTEARTTLSSSR
jgi:hypothetical protein